MGRQLDEIAAELESARERLRTLAADDAWQVRPDEQRWSAGECVAHLNLTSRAFIPLLESALEQARALGTNATRRYRRDPLGWFLWRTLGPPVRFRVSTTPSFVPESDRPREELISEFEAHQQRQLELVEQATALPLDRVRIVSPFDQRVRYNAYSALSILARHQHRHLWQAEAAIRTIRERRREEEAGSGHVRI